MYKRKKQDEAQNLGESSEKDFSLEDHDFKKELKRGIPFFLFAGFVAYLLGIGGGVINTPALHLIFGYPIHNATAISTGIIFFTAIVNTLFKIFMGQINYVMGLLVAAGSIIGALIGAKISNKMPKYLLQFFVAILLVGLGINMLL